MPRSRANHTSWSLTRMSMYRPRSWGMYPQLRRSLEEAGRPSQQTSPRSGRITPNVILISVDFPAPFGPSRPTTRPAGTSKSTSSSTRRSPKAWVIPFSVKPLFVMDRTLISTHCVGS